MIASRFVGPCLPLFCCVLAAACGGDDPEAQTSSSGGPTTDAGETSSSSSSSGAAADGGASSSGGSSSGAAVGPDTVSGTITDDHQCGVAGVVVLVEGHTVTTDAAGGFQIPGITAPYDLHIVVPSALAASGTSAASKSFIGLNELNPHVAVSAKGGACSQATLTGTIAALTGSDSRYVRGASPYGDFFSGEGAIQSFTSQPRWPNGVSTVDAQVLVLDVTTAEYKFPTEYKALGRASAFGLVPGGSASVTPAMNPLASYDAIVSIPVATGHALGQSSLNISYGLGLRGGFVFTDNTPTANFTIKVPNDPSWGPVYLSAFTFASGFSASRGGTVRLDPTTPAVSFAFIDPPTVTAPVAGSTGYGPGDSVSWVSAGLNCLYSVSVYSAEPGVATWSLQTAATSAIVPDLAAQGNPVPVAQALKLAVSAGCFSVAASVDGLIRETLPRVGSGSSTTLAVTSR